MTDIMPLPHEEVLDLIKQAQAGDDFAQEKLVTHNLALVKSIVKRFIGRGVDYDDLFQIGSMGLVKAIRHYDAKFQVRFSTYAVPMIAGEIKRFLRDDGMIKVGRSLKELAAKVAAAQEQFRRQHGHDPGIQEIAQQLEVPSEDVALALEAARPHLSIYEQLYDEDSGAQLIDQMKEPSEDDGMQVDRIMLKELLGQLEQKERQLIVLRYFQDRTQSEIAGLLGVSQVQVSRLESKIIKKLREAAK